MITTISLTNEETESGRIRQNSVEKAMSLDSTPGMVKLYFNSRIPRPMADTTNRSLNSPPLFIFFKAHLQTIFQ